MISLVNSVYVERTIYYRLANPGFRCQISPSSVESTLAFPTPIEHVKPGGPTAQRTSKEHQRSMRIQGRGWSVPFLRPS